MKAVSVKFKADIVFSGHEHEGGYKLRLGGVSSVPLLQQQKKFQKSDTFKSVSHERRQHGRRAKDGGFEAASRIIVVW